MKEKELNKYIEQETWFHGTTLKNWKRICEIGVQSQYNKGLSVDFGYGFYLAPKFKQAESYITRMLPYMSFSEEEPVPIVIEFNLNVKKLIDTGKYKFTTFLHFDMEFAKFVAECRMKPDVLTHDYDFIIGVMTDSNPLKLIDDFRHNIINENDLYEGLLKWNSMEQISIHNQSICDMLSVNKVYNLIEEKEEDVNDYNKRIVL